MSERDEFLRRWRERAPSALPIEFDHRRLAELDARRRLRNQVAIVSMGNRAEAHSAALAPDIDDRIGIYVGSQVANATGARYLGHCPYATDRLGGLAAIWSPACMPVPEFVAACTRSLRGLLSGSDASEVWLLSGHGGNGALVPELPRVAEELGVRSLLYELALRVPPEWPHLNTQHAGDLEHSVAAALGPGCFDAGAFAALQARLAADVIATVCEQPAVGGFAGYYTFGDERFAAIRDRYPGVKSSVRSLLEGRQISADPVIGARVLAYTVASLAAQIEAHGLTL
jgi:creatinine amidohydrolase/Fe(II)-dependent formamide hydrolase-like protein